MKQLQSKVYRDFQIFKKGGTTMGKKGKKKVAYPILDGIGKSTNKYGKKLGKL
jgi:hypothetical protein